MAGTSDQTIAAIAIDNKAAPRSHVPASVTPQLSQESTVHNILYEPCVRPSGIRGSRWSSASGSQSRDDVEPENQRTRDKSIQTNDQPELDAASDTIGLDVNDQSNEEVHTDASEALCSSGEVRIAAIGDDGVSRTHSQDSLNTWPPRSPGNRQLNSRTAVHRRRRLSDSGQGQSGPIEASSGPLTTTSTMPQMNWTTQMASARLSRNTRHAVFRIRMSSLVVYVVVILLVSVLLQWVFLVNHCPALNDGARFHHRLY